MRNVNRTQSIAEFQEQFKDNADRSIYEISPRKLKFQI